MSSSKKRSPIWQYFDLNSDDNKYASCLLCQVQISRGGEGKKAGTSSMSNHLRSKHPEEFKLISMVYEAKQSRLLPRNAENLIEIKISNSPENSNVEETTLFEAEEIESQAFHTSKTNQNTTINDSFENESEEDSNPCVDPLTSASHLQKRNRTLIKTEEFTPDGTDHTEETQSQNTCHCSDEFRIYGEYVASQLKQLSIEESLLARDKIQSILTQSRLKDLGKIRVYSK